MGTNQAQLGEIGRFCYILLQPGWRHVNMSALMQLPQGWAPLPQFMGLGGLYRRYGGYHSRSCVHALWRLPVLEQHQGVEKDCNEARAYRDPPAAATAFDAPAPSVG